MPEVGNENKSAIRREKRYQKLCASIERLQKKVDKADRTLTRGTRQLIKLERQRVRMQKAMRQPPKPIRQAPPVEATLSDSASDICSMMIQGRTFEEAEEALRKDDLDIPASLRRDKAAADAVRQEVAEAKKAQSARAAEKRVIKAQHRHADLTGARRKMPLEGRAAMAAISKS
jgi:chromosome segregation ATPase